jgi:hypothetical protein
MRIAEIIRDASACVLVLLLTHGTGKAAGLNLSWGACEAEGGIANKTFACNTNTGSSTLYGSFSVAEEIDDITGLIAKIRIRADAPTLPNWWIAANVGSCRVGAFSTGFSFAGVPGTECLDPWDGQLVGAVGGYRTFWTTPQVSGGANRAELVVVGAVPSSSPVVLAAANEYYGFWVKLNYSKTVGGACDGCLVPVCLEFSEIEFYRSDGSTRLLTGPLVSNVATWQSSETCLLGAPVHNATWKRIKALHMN